MRRSIVKPSSSASYPSGQHDVTLLQRLDTFFTQFISILVSPTTQKVVLRSAALTAVLFASVAAACVAYLSFYWRFIPNLAIENDVYLQYGYSRPPFAIVTFKPDTILLDQPYDIVLDLQVPLSPVNLNLGNFMTVLDLKTASNETVYQASRPATILQTQPTRSWLPLANRGTSLSIQLGLNEVLERKRFSSHVSHAYLEVGRQDGYSSDEIKGMRELQIYAAKLRFHAVFHGLRWFMYNYRLTAFATFTTLFLFSELVAVIFVWSIISYRRSLPASEEKKDVKAQMEQADREEQEEFEKLQVKSTGRSMGTKGGVLSALKDIGSEEEVVEVEDVKAESEDEGWTNEAKDDKADDETIGGSSTSGEASSMGTFNTKSSASSGSSKSAASKSPQNKDV